MNPLKRFASTCLTLLLLAVGLGQPANADDERNPVVPLIEQFTADLETLGRRYRVPLDNDATAIKRAAISQSLKQLQALDFESLSRVAQTDYLLLRSEMDYRLSKLALEESRDAQAASLLPYAGELTRFLKNRENVEPISAEDVATTLDHAAAAIEKLVPTIEAPEASEKESTQELQQKRLNALRATELLRAFQRSLKEAHGFYLGYDPLYSWWVAKPMERLRSAMEKHHVALRERVVGISENDQDTIIGLPIGAEGLKLELQHEWIAHAPSELVELAEREMAWCDEQMLLASRELGCGEDWRKAMELVKSKHVQPGEQPQMIRDLAWESIRFLEAHDLLTIPPLAASGWTMEMMSPERQRVNPYFLGGDTIIVSFPTDAMTQEEKMMSMRSNNEHFSRATVHHELIPGHHLQYYMMPRYRPYRRLFNTPFWMEGWALYWEMQLWDLDFARGPEDRVGMLFWRKHRCARIIFSLSYHLGTMSPDECVSYLVERVGHERSAAAAEVRRSIMGGYSPLYQAAYMLGGMQLRELYRELVQSGAMSNRQFHDAVLHENSIPIEVLRNYLADHELNRDTQPSWQFAN